MPNPNNTIVLTGHINSEPVKSFRSTQGEQFYQVYLETTRKSGQVDIIPVVFSQTKLKEVNSILVSGERARITGEVRSTSKPRNDGSDKLRLIVSVFTRSIEQFVPEDGEHWDDLNEAKLTGTITRMGALRTTPGNRTIVDFTLSVPGINRTYKVPCICWGRTAEWFSTVEPNSLVTVFGRFQSREYRNKLGEDRTAYELSVYDLRAGGEDPDEPDTGSQPE